MYYFAQTKTKLSIQKSSLTSKVGVTKLFNNKKVMSSKSTLRSFMKAHLRQLSRDLIHLESVKVAHNAVAIDLSTRSHPSIFLSMPSGELDTSPLIEELMRNKGHAFIPKVVGGKYDDMVMVRIESLEEINSFPKSKWGIPEPPVPQDLSIENYGMIDVVFVPGVAFDRQCRRLGHGKGYYGS